MSKIERYLKTVEQLLKEEGRAQSRERQTDSTVQDETEYLLFTHQEDLTRSGQFTPEPTTDRHEGEITTRDQFPIRGKGRIENIVIITFGESFNVRLEVDDDNVLNNDFRTIEKLSDELVNVSAYAKQNSDRVLSIQDYTFEEYLNITIFPKGELTVELARAEVIIEEFRDS